MTLLELLKLLRLHVKRIVIVTMLRTVAVGADAAAKGIISPEYSAGSTPVISQGTIAAVGGIARSTASGTSGNGVMVEARAVACW